MEALVATMMSSPVQILDFMAFWTILARYDIDLCYLVHAIGAVIFGILSISSASESLETLLVKYSFGYFVAHGYEMIRTKTSTNVMLFHHALALTLLLGVFLNPDFITLKATSHVLLTEFSTLFLYAWEKYPSKIALASFTASYTASRGLFLGHFVFRIFTAKDPLDVASRLPIGPFHYFTLLLFALNLLYMAKILFPGIPAHLKKLEEVKPSVNEVQNSMY
jgi:TLC domain